MNVKEADATIRFAHDFKSAGEICTLNAINEYGKPRYDVNLFILGDMEGDMDFSIQCDKTARWLWDNKIKTLNVAGNRNGNFYTKRGRQKNVEALVYIYMCTVFHSLRGLTYSMENKC